MLLLYAEWAIRANTRVARLYVATQSITTACSTWTAKNIWWRKRERKTILSLLEFSRKNKFLLLLWLVMLIVWERRSSLFLSLQKMCCAQTVHTCSMLELIGMKRFWFFVSLCDSSLHTNWNVFRHHILSFVSIEKIVNAFWQIVNVY